MGWNPKGTAPKDGTFVLLLNMKSGVDPYASMYVGWSNGGDEFLIFSNLDHTFTLDDFTHWMPLPEPPS